MLLLCSLSSFVLHVSLILLSSRGDLEGAVRAVRCSKAVGGVGRPKGNPPSKHKSVPSSSSKGKKPAHKRSAAQRERCPKAGVNSLSAAEDGGESIAASEAAEPSIDGESLGWADAEAGMENTENEDQEVVVGVNNDGSSVGGCSRYSWGDDDLPGEVNTNR